MRSVSAFALLIGDVHAMYGAPGKVGGLLNGAAVGEKYDGVCVSDTPEEIKLKVGLLSSETTPTVSHLLV